MRRGDKAIVDRAEIDRIIRHTDVCRLGLVDDAGPYIVPMSFGYDPASPGTFYFHSALEGRKIRCIERESHGAFEIDRMIKTGARRTGEPCTWSMAYESVMGTGDIEVVTDADEKSHALRSIMEHYSGTSEWEFPDAMLARTAVLALTVREICGKRSLLPPQRSRAT
jgi:hypothetical protein